jgi:queuine tRNA-ribosyltransferase
MKKFSYTKYKNGRIGKISTLHGEISTPAFIFCGTKGAIKGLDHSEIFDETQILLCNTFHLRDQADKIEKLGGLHKFINWNKPIITDSGGFQIFSLGNGHISDEIKGIKNRKENLVKIFEDGCWFKNPLNGEKNFFSAKISIETQIKLGVDLVVSFDECTTSNSGYEYTKKSLERSHKWEEISLNYFEKNAKDHQMLYGIVQGGIFHDLRDKSINFVNEKNFFGHCIGGSLGKTKEEMYEIVKYVAQKLDQTRPIHLLGIGKPEDIFHLAPFIDTFDCVEPTRIARHGNSLIKKGKLNMKNSKFAFDSKPLDENCLCSTCKNFSRAYIHYLFKAKEIAGIQLLVRHNIHFMNTFMKELREAIANNELEKIKEIWL